MGQKDLAAELFEAGSRLQHSMNTRRKEGL